MKKFIKLLSLLLILLSISSYAQDNNKKIKLSIYGNMLYQHYDYGPNQKATPNGSNNDNRSIVDIPKFVLAPTFYFDSTFFIDTEFVIFEL